MKNIRGKEVLVNRPSEQIAGAVLENLLLPPVSTWRLKLWRAKAARERLQGMRGSAALGIMMGCVTLYIVMALSGCGVAFDVKYYGKTGVDDRTVSPEFHEKYQPGKQGR